jgi:hypothetical protein
MPPSSGHMRCAGNMRMSILSPSTMFWLQIACSGGTSLGGILRPSFCCRIRTALSG